jgi:predicted DNA-binding ribbon-helix-helix protein
MSVESVRQITNAWQSEMTSARRRGRKAVAVYLQVEKWRELKVIAALTDTTLDKLLQSGADMVIEKFKRTRGGSLSL